MLKIKNYKVWKIKLLVAVITQTDKYLDQVQPFACLISWVSATWLNDGIKWLVPADTAGDRIITIITADIYVRHKLCYIIRRLFHANAVSNHTHLHLVSAYLVNFKSVATGHVTLHFEQEPAAHILRCWRHTIDDQLQKFDPLPLDPGGWDSVAFSCRENGQVCTEFLSSSDEVNVRQQLIVQHFGEMGLLDGFRQWEE